MMPRLPAMAMTMGTVMDAAIAMELMRSRAGYPFASSVAANSNRS